MTDGVIPADKFKSKRRLIPLRLQPQLYKPADGFGSTRHVSLGPPPLVDLCQLFLMPPLADKRAYARPRAADLLFVVRNS
jgi:hypothetical protein